MILCSLYNNTSSIQRFVIAVDVKNFLENNSAGMIYVSQFVVLLKYIFVL